MTTGTRYARSGDADIAYRVYGDGPTDIVLSYDWGTHLEALAEQPLFEAFLLSLARFSRVLWFDMRGIGMSSSVVGDPPIEWWMDDLVAVMDAEGSETATLVAHGHATQMAVMAAASHPERVSSLVLMNGFARYARAEDYPAGMPPHVQEIYKTHIETNWGNGTMAYILGPSIADRPGIVDWWGRVERLATTPVRARSRLGSVLDLDVRHVLPLVEAPTLVVHSRDNEFVRVAHGRYLAEHIPGARLVERDSADHWPLPDADLVGAIEEFVTGSRAEAHDVDRVLATVLFVDVVGSTEQVREIGDSSWRILLDRFEETTRNVLDHHGGTLVDTAGDGLLATFDGPARAIRCAQHIRDDVRRVGLEVRSGLHAGEVTRRSDSIAGITVHIGARVAALAGPSEVLVTRTMRDLVAGSGIAFEDRGEHELKGVPDRWALYAAVG
ncbi:MAG TPA: adenylate/guanylate cyclase domain-containing protein [Gaiellaceae bacterium]|nr:adenylate/guanylate cyclase domain-containing protein [Gaiellaceae bacterium]